MAKEKVAHLFGISAATVDVMKELCELAQIQRKRLNRLVNAETRKNEVDVKATKEIREYKEILKTIDDVQVRHLPIVSWGDDKGKATEGQVPEQVPGVDPKLMDTFKTSADRQRLLGFLKRSRELAKERGGGGSEGDDELKN